MERFARWVASVGSQEGAAERIGGTSQMQVSRWVRGVRVPSLSDAKRIEVATAVWDESPITVAEWAEWAAARTATGTDG